PDGPIRVGVLLEGSKDGVEARSARMADLLGKAEVTADPPEWWPGAPRAGAGETLIRVSFWVSALARVLAAVGATAARTGVSPVMAGSAGAGVLYLRVGLSSAATAEFTGALRGAVAGERGAVAVLAAPPGVRRELIGRGGMSGMVPGLALMRA